MTGSPRVFREAPEGKLELVGDFEGLYREEDDPWDQSGAEANDASRYYAVSRARVEDYLSRRYFASSKIVEIGCGHGWLGRKLSQHGYDVLGVDVSPTAVRRARDLHRSEHRSIDFEVGDVVSQSFLPPRTGCDVVIWGQMLWYVLHQLPMAVENSISCLRSGGELLITQAFLRHPQRYGAEIVDGFVGLLRAMDRFHPRLSLEYASIHHGTPQHDDGLVSWRLQA